MSNREIPAEFRKLPELADKLAKIADRGWGGPDCPWLDFSMEQIQYGEDIRTVSRNIEVLYLQYPVDPLLAWMGYNLPGGLEHSRRLKSLLDGAVTAAISAEDASIFTYNNPDRAAEAMVDALGAIRGASGCVRELCRFLEGLGETESTPVESKEPIPSEKLSKHYTPKELVKIFPWQWSAIKQRLDDQRIRNVKHGDRDYQIHVDDLPTDEK